jgi:hypothetical protein
MAHQPAQRATPRIFLMTDLVAQARQAREKLAAALALLQDPAAGNLIDSVAEPVAKAMGALHQIESSGGQKLPDSGPLALDAVRSALGSLQAQPQTPVSDQATEHIAGSLGLVHGLAEQAKQAAAAPATAAAPETAKVASPPQDVALDSTQTAPQQPAQQAAPQPEPEIQQKPAPAAPSGALDATLPTPTKPADMVPNVSLDSTQASVRSGGITAPTQESAATPAIKRPEPEPAAQANRSSKMAAPPERGKPDGALDVEANLGAHSPTNFYKGLSGNDVVDDGGLFVATYEIPAIGTQLWISVHMPGGYQFEAVAVVRWTRETGAGDAPPGFGCAFQSVTDEARKLIYRYVRNREPLFHDDL